MISDKILKTEEGKLKAGSRILYVKHYSKSRTFKETEEQYHTIFVN